MKDITEKKATGIVKLSYMIDDIITSLLHDDMITPKLVKLEANLRG